MNAVDIAREYFPDADDDEIGYLLWNETGFPCFWRYDDPEESLRLDLARIVCREHFGMFEYFDADRCMDDAMRRADGL